MEDFSQIFQTIVRALYMVAGGISDVSYKEHFKSEIFLFVEAYFRRDVELFKERGFILDFFLKTAMDLQFTAEENYIVLHREIKSFTDKFVAHANDKLLVSGILDFRKLFPEKPMPEGGEAEGVGSRFGINLPIRAPKMRSFSGNRIVGLTERQQSILELLCEKESIPLMDVLARFPEMNEKTIRNDLRLLCEKGYVNHIGSGGRGSRYQFVREVSSI
ncbi:MAG: hypothetical protein HZA35_03010 [Parcubacteria group bacterium]|nr:hypothetical protein [Parcubacteria group bacterium]